MDHFVGILQKFGLGSTMEINWHKSVANWCNKGHQPCWVEKIQWKWVASGDLSKIFGTPFGLHLELQNIDQFLVDMVKAKL